MKPMLPKRRGYQREVPPEDKMRDYKLFVIASEGKKREPQYFDFFRYFPRVQVDLIGREDGLGDEQENSSPKWVMDRAAQYEERIGLDEDDDLWIVLDVDRWDVEQLREIAQHCEEKPNWHVVISNPCFEVWLYYHFRSNKPTDIPVSRYKKVISELVEGGYNPLRFLPKIREAIDNAKGNDSNLEHFLPEKHETKVYLLGEAFFKFISINDWERFVKVEIPNLEQQKIRKNRRQKN